MTNDERNQRYNINRFQNFNVDETLYNTYRKVSLLSPSKIAIYDTRKEKAYTNKELLSMIDKASAGLKALGINSQSKIGCIIENTVEEAITLLSANKLGALVRCLDFTKGPEPLKYNIDECGFNLLIIDEHYLEYEPLVNSKNLPVLVIGNEMSHNYTNYEELYKYGTGENIQSMPYINKRPAVIINSSGTTGAAKPIVHSNSTVNSATLKVLRTDYPLGNNNVIENIVPPHIGLGLITSLYTGLISGTQVAQIKDFSNSKSFIETMVKFTREFNTFAQKYNLGDDALLLLFSTPLFLRFVLTNPSVTDLTRVGCMLAAGSKLYKEDQLELEKIARQKGCFVPISSAYGTNENCGGITYSHINNYKFNSAGIPAYETQIMIVDPQTHEPKAKNEEGKIITRSESNFLEYFKKPELTENARIILNDGTVWFDTKDIGYLDEDGFLFVTGREKRIIIRFDFKISLDEIEEKLKSLSFIDNAATIVKESGTSLEEFVAFVTPNELFEGDISKTIADKKLLSPLEMPNEYIIIDNIPFMNNGKIDYQKLTELYKNNKKLVRIKQNVDSFDF